MNNLLVTKHLQILFSRCPLSSCCSCELLVRTACPQPQQPVPVPCSVGPVDTRFFGKGLSLNVTALLPYTTYEVRVVCYNNMGSTASVWVSITTLKEGMPSLLPLCQYLSSATSSTILVQSLVMQFGLNLFSQPTLVHVVFQPHSIRSHLQCRAT